MENVHKQSSYKQSCRHPPRELKRRERRPSLGHDKSLAALGLGQGDSDHELGGTYFGMPGNKAKRGSDEDLLDDDEEDFFTLKTNLLDELEKENYRFRSMSDFYESIPDYTDLHHLSETEFYSRLERLKIQQQELMDLVEGRDSPPMPKIRVEPVPQSATHTDDPLAERVDDDLNSVLSLEAPGKLKRPTSSLSKTKKSVRISSGTTYRTDFSDICDLDGIESPLLNLPNSRSKSASPRRTRSLTVPKPFKMTQREEEERMLEDLANSKKYLSKISISLDDAPPETCRRPKIKPFKANPVPLTSRIPLYDHIKEDHRRKSTLAKLNSAIELQAQIKPFKFNESNSRCLSRAASTPNLSGRLDQAKFRATPCPKNLFSNYFCNKLWEDDYFRALNRKIRAEEMLKISTLPPSMAKRAESCFSDLDSNVKSNRRRKKRKGKKTRQYEFKDHREIPFERSSSCSKRQKPPSTSSTGSLSRETTPLPASYPVNRPNLAATLRVQSARRKVRELAKPKSIVPDSRATVPLSKGSKEAWGVRKAPAWKSMTYDPSNVEDIALRLATRRAEQRLRQEEHEISMELMRQRVRAAPLLLEGPTQWGPKVGQVSHHCRSAEPVTITSGKSSSRRRCTHNSS